VNRSVPAEIAARPGRSHPPSLLRLAERLIRDEALFARSDMVLCACSGGPDSIALLHVLARLRDRLGHRLVAHGVDHGLRAEAAAELELTAKLAASLDVPFSTTSLALSSGGNLQARAREARLEALGQAAQRAGAKVIAMGHTADDRAETLLLRLLRGAGPRGLAVLPPSAPLPTGPADIHLIRPILEARRADVLAHLNRHHLAFAEDPSNRDPRFTRVRVRRELIPLLEELSPRVVEHLCALANMLSEPTGMVVDGPLAELGRAQRREVERARRLGRRELQLRLRGGRKVRVTFSEDQIVLIDE